MCYNATNATLHIYIREKKILPILRNIQVSCEK